MAPRATDSLGHKYGACGIGNVGGDLILSVDQIAGIVVVGVIGKKTCSNHRFLVAGGQFVAGQLLFDKPVIRLVVIESIDHIIAIAVHVGARRIVFEAGAVGVSCEVEPAAGLTLPLVGGGQ